MQAERQPLSSVDLKTLSTLKIELLTLQQRMNKGTYDDLEFYIPVEQYFQGRIKELESRIKK